MDSPEGRRLDKWLWSVRRYKTRSLAAAACRGGHVTVGGTHVKPAREVRVGDTIVTQHENLTRTTRVVGFAPHRVGAAAVKQLAEDLTPASEYAKRSDPQLRSLAIRPKGSGRPTKKDRRVMERFF